MCGSGHVFGSAGHSHHLGPEGARLMFDKDIEPIAQVSQGEIVELDTKDCAGGAIATSSDLIRHIDDLIEELGGLNFVTGPLAIRGVRAGDVLRVTVLDIDPAPETRKGFIALAPGFGSLVHDSGRGVQPSLAPVTTICDVTREQTTIPLPTGTVRLPTRPFIGTIGVAPRWERRMTLSQSPEYVGDIDLPQFCAGSTLLIRANHEGGLLSLGDVHAVQGDGEFGGMAVEIAARLRIRVDAVPASDSQLGRLPMLMDARRVGVVAAFQGTDSSGCVRAAAVELAELLVRLGMSMSDALQYLSAAAKIRLGNMFEPFYSAYVYLDREYLPIHLPPDLETVIGTETA